MPQDMPRIYDDGHSEAQERQQYEAMTKITAKKRAAVLSMT